MIVTFGVSAYVKNFIRSDEFRETVAEKVSDQLRTQTRLDSVNWEGTSAYANRFKAQGYEDANFTSMEISGLRTDLDLSLENFRRGVWKVSSVDASQLDLVFSDKDRLAGPYANSKAILPEEMLDEEESSGPQSEGFFSRLIPKRTEVGPVSIGNTNLYWYGDKEIRATGVHTSIYPPANTGPIRLEAKGGTLKGDDLPKMTIGHLKMNWAGSDFYISDAEFYLEEGAKLHVHGDVKQSDDEILLEATLTDLKASEVIPPDLATKFSGVISVDATVTGKPSDSASLLYKGTVTVDKGVLESVPALESLAKYTSTERFRRIAFSQATAEFIHQNGKTEIYNIQLQSDGLARLEGHLQVENRNLNGQLQLGVIPNTLSWIPGAERKVFVDAREGHLWTNITVSGTLDDPKHDLMQKLAAGGVESTMEQINDILNNPDEAKEKSEDLIKSGMDLLNTFLK